MADTKISGLPASTTPLAGTEVLPIVQSSNTVQVSVANLTAGRAVATGALTVTGTLGVTGAARFGSAGAAPNDFNVITSNAGGSIYTFDNSNTTAGTSTLNAYLRAYGASDVSIIMQTAAGASGQLYAFGIDNSDASSFVISANTSLGTSNLLRLSSAGTLSGGTSGTGYSFSGTAPAGSLALDASGNITASATSGYFANNGATTSGKYISIANTGGTAQIGVESSVGGTQIAGTSAYMTAIVGKAGIGFTGNDSTIHMTLNSSGNLLVGRTSDSFGTVGMTLRANGTISATADGNEVIDINRLTSDGGIQRFFRSGTQVGSVSVTTAATSYNTTSDQRLKKNIQDADSASSLIDSLQVRQFDWKSDNSHQRYGFVAQELVTVVPEAVHQPADPDEMMAVDYSKLVPMLVKEIQSLRQRLSAANL